MNVIALTSDTPYVDVSGESDLTQTFTVPRGCEVQMFFAALNPSIAGWSRTWEIILEPDSKLILYGVVVGAREQVLRQRLIVRHGLRSVSRVSIHGALMGKATASIYGAINIPHHASQSDGFLEERMLLLDPGTHVDAVPEVEIQNQDVKAKHAASIGRVSPEQLWYLETRGLSHAEARRMIVEGFLSVQIGHFPAFVRSKIESQLEEQLSFVAQSK